MARSTQCADTGGGSTVTFASGITASLKFRRINQGQTQSEILDCSDISTTGGRKTMPGDNHELPEVELEYILDTFDTLPTVGQYVGVMTITYPTRSGETTPATKAGTAFVSRVSEPVLAANELQIVTIGVKYDGMTPPVFTKST